MKKITVFFRIVSKSLSTIVRSGFSLIELLVVVAIIGILAAIGSVGYSRYIESARNAAIIAIAKQISDALQACDTNNSCKDYVPPGGNPKNVWDVLLGDGTGTNGLIASMGSKNPWDNTPINGPTMQVVPTANTPPYSIPILSASPYSGNVDGLSAGNLELAFSLMQTNPPQITNQGETNGFGYTFCGGLGHIYINVGSVGPNTSNGSLPTNGIQIAACTSAGLQSPPGNPPGLGLGDVNSPAAFSLINMDLSL